MNKSEKIYTFKKTEIAILYYTMCDYTTDDVAGTLNLAASTVTYHLKNIYKELEIEGKGKQKRENLIRQYQWYVFQLIRGEDDIDKWIRKFDQYLSPPDALCDMEILFDHPLSYETLNKALDNVLDPKHPPQKFIDFPTYLHVTPQDKILQRFKSFFEAILARLFPNDHPDS